jgi:hypothetical protein
MNECEHWECVLWRVSEMIWVAEVIERRDPRLSWHVLHVAAELIHAPWPVRCTHVPRPGLDGRSHAGFA